MCGRMAPCTQPEPKHSTDMKIIKITPAVGITIDAVLIRHNCINTGDDFTRGYEDLCYAQNRLVLKSYMIEYFPDYETGGFSHKFLIRPEYTVLCDYVVIPEYDEALANVLHAEPKEDIAGKDHDIDSTYSRPSDKKYNLQDVKDFLERKFSYGVQCYDSRNTAGNPMENVYEKDGVTIDYCPGWDYIEIFGLKTNDFDDIKAFLTSLNESE